MKIYTYYEDIQFLNQEKLIDVWESSWKNQGFDPIVLTRADAEKNSLFKEFEIKMQKLHTEIMGKPLRGYGMSCYYRWLAYGALNDKDAFYVSDYDVINRSWHPIEPINSLHMMERNCPSIASGTTKQMQDLSELFLSLTEDRLSYLKSQRENMHWYHDQEFFTYNLYVPHNSEYLLLMEKNNITYRNIDGWLTGGRRYDPKHKCNSKLLHISHFCTGQVTKKYPEYKEMHGSDLRVVLAKQYMENP